MRDAKTAFDYLTGALTGGDKPVAVGQKFSGDGAPINCPGYTTICHVDPSSDAFAALVAAQGDLKTGPSAAAFTFMPAASLHMTIFEGVIDYARMPDRWPQHLALDATIAHATHDAERRLTEAPFERTFKVRPVGVFGGFSIAMAGVNDTEEWRLRQTRDALRDALNLHRPDHEAYQFHITLAYLLRWLSPDEAHQVIDLSRSVAAALVKDMPTLSLGPIELCGFTTMHHFAPIARIGA
ncbi:MAG: DUF1868 domain-containing protein [Pseudomonadota bacterium]